MPVGPIGVAEFEHPHDLRKAAEGGHESAAIPGLVRLRPPNCVALQGESGVHRVRVGDYRIVYEVFDRLLVVQVVRVGHRREVVR